MTINQTKPGDIEDSLKKADFEFKQRRFDKAAPLYEQALEALRANRPADHGDTIYCMETLADALAFSGDFQKAHQVLLEADQVRQRVPGANNIDQIATKYRLAKMSEMLRMIPQSLMTYREGIRIGEQSLYAGHPLLIAMYSAELKILQLTDGDEQEIEVLQKKINASAPGANSMADNILESMRLKEYGSFVLPPAPKSDADRKFKLPIAAIRNTLIAVVLLGAIGAAAYVGMKHEAQKKQEKTELQLAKTFVGQSFESADGQLKLLFSVPGRVNSVIDGVHRDLPIEILPADAQLSDDSHTDLRRSFKRLPKAMLADDGDLLYAQDSPDSKVVARVSAIASAAQKYYDEHKEYPTTADQLAEVDPKIKENSVTGQEDEPVFIAGGKERDWAGGSEPALGGTLRAGYLLSGEQPLAPGAVHCYTFLSGDKYQKEGVKCTAFFIRASNTEGKLLPHSSGKFFVGAMLMGAQPKIAGLYKAREPDAQTNPLQLVKLIPEK